MKVCILTYPIHSNMGFILQAWALQHTVQKMGHEVKVIGHFVPAPPYWRRIAMRIKRLLLFILSRGKNRTFFQYIPTQKDLNTINQSALSFFNLHIRTTPPFYSFSDFKKLKTDQFDAFIVGSDQVWRKKSVTSIKTYFFDFIKAERIPIMISYAASFGVDYLEYSAGDIRKCRKLLQRFSAVSVREQSGIDLCKKFFNVNAELVLDPTLLVTKDEYCSLVQQQERLYPGKYGLSYILDRTDFKNNTIEIIQRESKLNFYEFLDIQKIEKVGVRRIRECIYPRIEDFLRCYRDAEYIITDSFHGMAFAIIFKKPFLAIVNSTRGATRFYSLLNQLGLKDRLITENAAETEILAAFHTACPWEIVQIELSERKKSSMNFLRKALPVSDLDGSQVNH